ncbi:hypothetical protein D3C78_864550 [compost metagenome]
MRCGDAGDFIRITEQYAGRDSAFCADSGCFNGTWLITFWQNNAFAGFTCQLSQLVTEGWRRETAAALRGGCQGFDPVSIDEACNVFLNFLDTLMVVNRNFQVEALQAQRGLPGVGVHHEYRQASRESAFAQFADARVHFVRAGQQNCTDFYAIHCGQTRCNQHVWTVCRSHQQRTCTEVFQHVRNATGTEGHGLHAAGLNVAFVDYGSVQVARHVDCASRNQIKAPRYRAQNRQWAAFAKLSRVHFHDFRFGRVVKNF